MNVIVQVLEEEERDFGRTIDKGRRYFRGTVEHLNQTGSKVVPGTSAFFMYSSMGFPFDLTEIMANELGMTVDHAGFQQAMEEFKALSVEAREEHLRKQNSTGEGVVPKLDALATDALEKQGVAATLSEAGKLSPDANPPAKAKLVAIYDPDTRSFVQAGEPGVTYGLVPDRTNFYHEAGGQLADSGKITTDALGGAVFEVMDVQGRLVRGVDVKS